MANMRAPERPGGERQLTRDSGDSANGEALSDKSVTRVKIVIPDDHSMVILLGSGDELLQVIERDFATDIHVRGNEITVTGPEAETALVARLFDTSATMVQKNYSASIVDALGELAERMAVRWRRSRPRRCG